METAVRIKEILCFLENSNLDFEFHGDEDTVLTGYSSLFNYREGTLTFISSLNKFKNYNEIFMDKNIRLILIDKSELIYGCFDNVIRVTNPKKVFFSLLSEVFEKESQSSLVFDKDKYNKKSIISPKAQIGKNVRIGVGCVIEDDVIIGENTVIHHNVVIKNKTRIGRNCTIFSGAIIGERGFNPNKLEDGSRHMLKHFGGVVIGDDVHIGECCCIAQGSIDDTVIKKGVKMNSMVRVAHNCVIGENTVITAPTFICGSVNVGKACHVAAITIRNQCNIGDNALLGLGAVVVEDVPAGVTVVGNPARSLRKKRGDKIESISVCTP